MKDSYRFKRMIITIYFMLLFIPGMAISQTNNFMIEDFIPEKFTDSQLRVDGNIGINGQETKYDRASISMPDIRTVDDTNTDNQNGSASARYKYEYQTVPSFLLFELDTEGSIQNRRSELSSNNWYGTNDYYQRNSTSLRTGYDFQIEPYIETGHYLINDFFISANLAAAVSLSEAPKDDSYIYTSDTNPVFPDTIENEIDKTWTYRDGDQHTYRMRAALLPGWGHVYEGKFGSTAMYIIDELDKAGLIAIQPTKSQMIELSSLVYQYRLEYAIDSRLHYIEALDGLIDYLG